MLQTIETNYWLVYLIFAPKSQKSFFTRNQAMKPFYNWFSWPIIFLCNKNLVKPCNGCPNYTLNVSVIVMYTFFRLWYFHNICCHFRNIGSSFREIQVFCFFACRTRSVHWEINISCSLSEAARHFWVFKGYGNIVFISNSTHPCWNIILSTCKLR